MPDKASQRVTVKDAAKELGCTAEYLRRQMQAGRWDLGTILRPGKDSKVYRYFIYRAKLDKFIGMSEEKFTAI